MYMTGEQFRSIYADKPEKACRTLFDEYCKYVYAVVFSKLRSTAAPEDIEECVSDVFAEVFFGLAHGKTDERELKPYISVIAKRRAVNRFYSLSGQAESLSLDSEEFGKLEADADTEVQTEQKLLGRELMEQINALGEPDSTIVIERYYYEHSSAEIAEKLGMKPSAVRMRAARAKSRLKKALGKKNGTL